jgi:hypothetical protein
VTWPSPTTCRAWLLPNPKQRSEAPLAEREAATSLGSCCIVYAPCQTPGAATRSCSKDLSGRQQLAGLLATPHHVVCLQHHTGVADSSHEDCSGAWVVSNGVFARMLHNLIASRLNQAHVALCSCLAGKLRCNLDEHYLWHSCTRREPLLSSDRCVPARLFGSGRHFGVAWLANCSVHPVGGCMVCLARSHACSVLGAHLAV